MKIKTQSDKCPYVTKDKEYKVNYDGGHYWQITDDVGDNIVVNKRRCAHIYGSWEIVDEVINEVIELEIG